MAVPEGAGMIGQDDMNRQLTGICKIEVSSVTRNGKATGFVGHLRCGDKDLYYLITNHHVLQGRRDKPSNITITFKDHNPLKGNELFSGTRWKTDNGTNLQDNTKFGLDYTMIEVKKEKLDELKISLFDLTPTDFDENDQLIVAGHPVIVEHEEQTVEGSTVVVEREVQKPLQVSHHRCKRIEGFLVFYGCATCRGSSGSPVLKVDADGALRVVALHRACGEKYLNYGSLFSAVLSHSCLIDGDVPETTKSMFDKYLEKVKWKPLDFATLLRLLKRVEGSWEQLASFLLKNELQYKIETIQKDAFHSNMEALMKVLRKWLNCTKREKRTWNTLCDTAKKYEDKSLEKYIQEKDLKNDLNKEPAVEHLQRWSANSPLCIKWYNFAVDLVGKQKADIIEGTCSGGGTHECLQKMLDVWYKSTTDHSWQVITNALTEIEEFSVINSIEDECLDLTYVSKRN